MTESYVTMGGRTGLNVTREQRSYLEQLQKFNQVTIKPYSGFQSKNSIITIVESPRGKETVTTDAIRDRDRTEHTKKVIEAAQKLLVPSAIR